MTDTIDRLLVRVEANAVAFEAQMKKVNRALYGSSAETRKTLDRIKRDTAAAAPQMFKPVGDHFRREVAGLSGILAGLFTAQQATQFADSWKQGTNSLAAAGVAAEDLATRQERLLRIANDSRSSMDGTVSLYTRLTIATQELGLSTESTLRLTELLSKSFQSSGKSTQEAASAALQLSQALASGTLQGDELRSLRENAPELALIIAKSMGVGIGALKELGAEGKITGQVVSQAILGAGDAIEAKFQATEMTVSQSLTVLNNQLGRYVGQTDASLSATDRLAQGIVLFANNLDDIIPLAATLAALIGGRYAVGMAVAGVQTGIATVNALAYQAALVRLQARQTGATGAQILLNAAMTANPIGLVITLVAALAGGLFLLAQRYGESAVAARELKDVTERGDQALADYERAAIAARDATKANAAAARESAAAHREEAAAVIAAARAMAQKRLGEAQDRADTATRAATEASRAVGVAGSNFSNAATSVAIGARAAAQGAIAQQAEAQRRAGEAVREVIRQEQELARIAAGINLGGMSDGTNSAGADKDDSRRGGGARGPSAEDVARQRELLALQMEIARLEAQGTEAAAAQARARQRELDVLNLTKQLTDAGVQNAEATAQAHVQAIAVAEEAARGFAILWEKNQKAIEDAEKRLRRANSILMDRLGFEVELARIKGDPVALRAAERELWIEERINALLEMRPELKNRQAARAVAEEERGKIDAAIDDAERVDRARSMARDFVDVLASDSWAEAAGRKFRDAAFDNLEDLLTTLFSGLTANGGGAGGSLGSMIGSALRAVIPGFAAGTNSAPGGLSYVHRGEVLTNLKPGTSVIPAHAVRAMGAMAGRAEVQPMPAAQAAVVKIIMEEGGLFAPRVQQISGPVAVQTTAQGVAFAQDRQQQTVRRQRQRLV